MNRTDADLIIRAATGGTLPEDGVVLRRIEGEWRFHQLTLEDIGAASVDHTHSASAISTGVIDAARLPTDLSSKGVCGKGPLPTAGVDGRLWFDTEDSLLKRDNGADWEVV